MNDYQQEQFEALTMVRQGLARLGADGCGRLKGMIADYLRFRQEVDRFLERHFSTVCTRTCYQDRTSACCSKDGIITFFADTVINALCASEDQLAQLAALLQHPNTGHRCVYLGDAGCRWFVSPVVCAMFLCDRAMRTVFDQAPAAQAVWQDLREREKRFKWPDRPVLFDQLEVVFMEMGYRSTLMHLNLSPGLLRVKQKAGLLEPSGGPSLQPPD